MIYNNDFPLERYPTFHTFTDPAVAEASCRNINTLLSNRAKYDGDKPFLRELNVGQDGSIGDDTRTYVEVDRLVDALCHSWRRNHPEVFAREDGVRETVGVLGRNGIEFVLTELALIRLGHTPLFVSTAMPPASIAAVIGGQHAPLIIHGPEHRSLAELVQKEEAVKGMNILQWTNAASLELSLSQSNPAPVRAHAHAPTPLPTDTAILVHSSGSTGFPKTISISHRGMLAFSVIWGCSDDSLIMTPLSHGYAQMGLFHALTTGRCLNIFPPTQPLTGPNLALSLSYIDQRSTALFAVPVALKLILETEGGTEILRQVKRVYSCGAPCPKPLGDQLVDQGVRLIAGLASSDAVAMMTSERDFEHDKEWEYLRVDEELIAPHVEFDPLGDGTHQLIFRSTWPSLNLRNLPGGGCATGDVVQQHPTRPGLWKWVRRTDDIIVHENGLKTWPIPIEAAVKSDSRIQDALVVGSDKPNAGLLVIPAQSPAGGVTSRAEILDIVLKVNADLPSYSVIVPELVNVLLPDASFVLAPKGSIVRNATLTKFDHVINKMFTDYVSGAGRAADTPAELTDEQTSLKLVRSEILHAVPKLDGTLDMDQSVFDQGVNSLAAMRIRNSLQRQLSLNPALSGNMVYEQETPRSLAKYLFARQTTSSSPGTGKGGSSELDKTKELLEKAKRRIEAIFKALEGQTKPLEGKREKRTILLTGATGLIGVHVLHTLANRESVDSIICLVRASDEAEAASRVDTSLQSRRLPRLADLAQSALIRCLPQQALSSDQALEWQVTDIVHLAWPVNFNLPVTTFSSSIDQLLDMISLAIRSGAHLHFASSISAYVRGSQPIPETLSLDPAEAADPGYSRSKWISENLLSYACRISRVKGSILRIGQITGDTVHGIWNDSEAIPLMVRSAQALKVLPDRSVDGAVSYWLPVDTLAAAIVGIITKSASEGEAVAIYNLWNEHPLPWSTVLKGVKQAGVNFDIVPYDQWLEKLRGGADLDAVPAARLVDYYTLHGGTFENVIYDTINTRTTLLEAWAPRALTEVDVQRMTTHWK